MDSKAQRVWLFTDNNIPVRAIKLINWDQGLITDCNGETFASGRYWINSIEVQKILDLDGYDQTPTPKVGDVATYRSTVDDPDWNVKKGDIVHSLTVTAVDAKGNVTGVTGLGGVQEYSVKNTQESDGLNQLKWNVTIDKAR